MRNPKPLNPRLAEYVDYINNTGQVPLAVEQFDEDWDPVGPMIRSELESSGYIRIGRPGFMEEGDGIRLRPDLIRSH